METGLYSIILNGEELQYVRNALDKGVASLDDGEEITLSYETIWTDAGDHIVEEYKVVVNEKGHALLEHLQFGTDHEKNWIKEQSDDAVAL